VVRRGATRDRTCHDRYLTAWPTRWKAAWCLYREADPAAEKWVYTQGLSILHGHSDQVAATVRRATAGLDPAHRAGAVACARYLTNTGPYLDYPTALTCGWPIATGVIEGACRHLIKDRMDLTGARWTLPGAEAVLKLRALHSNSDFDDYWEGYAKPRNVCNRENLHLNHQEI
jgi:hypothetical protein